MIVASEAILSIFYRIGNNVYDFDMYSMGRAKCEVIHFVGHGMMVLSKCVSDGVRTDGRTFTLCTAFYRPRLDRRTKGTRAITSIVLVCYSK